MISEKCLGKRIATRLFNKVIKATPSHVAIPGNLDISHHLAYTCAFQECRGHGLRALQVTHQAVSYGHIDLWVGGIYGMMLAGQIQTIESSFVFASKDTVFISIAKLKIAFGGMARGHEKIGLSLI